MDEPELHFGDDVVVPDLAGWRTERPPELKEAYFTVVPEWVCEVLSLRTARWDRQQKANLYAREGVRWLWLVDPGAELVEAFALQDARWSRLGAWSGDRSRPSSSSSRRSGSATQARPRRRGDSGSPRELPTQERELPIATSSLNAAVFSPPRGEPPATPASNSSFARRHDRFCRSRCCAPLPLAPCPFPARRDDFREW